MTKTIIGESINKKLGGYLLNAELSKSVTQKILALQTRLSEKFGAGVWHQPPESLHITLFDWLAPLVDYGQNKDVLFREIFPIYDRVVSDATKNIGPINVTFRAVKAGPAAIFMVGEDDGQFEQIRQDFMKHIKLLPGTKKPPEIIHSTMSRFTKEIELEPIQDFLSTIEFSINETITSFRLAHEQVDPMLKFDVIKEYRLH